MHAKVKEENNNLKREKAQVWIQGGFDVLIEIAVVRCVTLTRVDAAEQHEKVIAQQKKVIERITKAASGDKENEAPMAFEEEEHLQVKRGGRSGWGCSSWGSKGCRGAPPAGEASARMLVRT